MQRHTLLAEPLLSLFALSFIARKKRLYLQGGKDRVPFQMEIRKNSRRRPRFVDDTELGH